MTFKEINSSDGLDGGVQEIVRKGLFDNIPTDVENGNYIYSSIKKEPGSYEDTLEDIDMDTLEEIYLERARYLLSADDLLEEMLLGKIQE